MALITTTQAKAELSTELREQTTALLEKFHNVFPQVEPNGIIFIHSKSHSKRPIRISAVRSPYDLVVSQKFILTSYGKAFDKLDTARKNMHIFRELLRIDDFEGGKLEDYEVKDFPVILAKYGLDWEENNDLTNIMNMTDSNVV